MSNFRIGQKVVCVDDAFVGSSTTGKVLYPNQLGISCPVKGDIVIIRGKRVLKGKLGLWFQEHDNSDIRDVSGNEVAFAAFRFRPLITPEQDISLFHALCPGLPVVPTAVLKPRVRVE